MDSINKLADTNFLINLFLSGKEQALDVFRSKVSGAIVLTSTIKDELAIFSRADISGLLTWIEKPGNATVVKYVDSTLQAAKDALEAAKARGAPLAPFEDALKIAAKDAGERRCIRDKMY